MPQKYTTDLDDKGRVCTVCNAYKEFILFCKDNRSKNGFGSICILCKREKDHKYRIAHREKYLEAKKNRYYANLEKNQKERLDYYHSHKEQAALKAKRWYFKDPEYRRAKQRENRAKVKSKVFEYYGGLCVCCAEANHLFLSIDHINNDGGAKRKIQRRDGNFYYWIVRNNFPNDLQLLCMNCNWGKYVNKGICPHKNK